MVSLKHESDLHRRLHNYLVQRYLSSLIYLQTMTILYCLARLIINFIRKDWITGSLWGVFGLLGPIIQAKCIKATKRTWLLTRRDIIFAQIKEKIGALLITAVVGYLMANNLISDDPNHIIFIGGADLTIVCLAFQITFSEWHSFAMLTMIVMVTLIIQGWTLESYTLFTKFNITLKYLTTAIIVTIFKYLEDRSFRELFSMKTKLEDKDSMHKEILDIVPEGIFILSQKLELVYSNKYFQSSILGTEQEDSITFEEFLPQVTNLQEITTEGNLQTGLNSPEPIMKKDLRYILTNFRGILQPYKSQNSTNESLQRHSIEAPMLLLQTLNKSHCIFRGLYKKSYSKNEMETVEIKLTWIIFEGQLSILVVIRKAPELALLKQLERAGRYKDEILASVSHELRTPINSNINFLYEALRAEGVKPYVKENLLDPAYKSAKLLLNLVNDILDVSQIKERKLRLVSQPCEIREIIKECHYLFDYQCRKKKINLEYVIENQVPKKLRTDPNRLTQIILNLLSNSYKFTYEGSIAIKASMEAGLIKIAVSDTGIGIKEEDKAKLMKKFEKIDLGDKAASNSTGAGLGLSIANSLAMMLGPDDSEKGGLKFDSEWGKGTTASFLLKSKREFTMSPAKSRKGMMKIDGSTMKTEQPLLGQYSVESDSVQGIDVSEFFDEDDKIELPVNISSKRKHRITFTGSDQSCPIEANSKVESDSSTQTPPLRPQLRVITKQHVLGCECPKIMVVDDDGFNILTIETMLKSLDIKSDTATSGVECLRKISQAEKCSPNCRKFGLILMDRNMPMKDGIQTTKELLAWNASIPDKWNIVIVGCTAYNEKEKQDEFLNAGALETLQKPLVKADLVKLIARYKYL